MRFHPFRRSVLPVLALLALAACNDEPDFNPTAWETNVDTITLYTASFTEYQGLPAAYDIRGRRTERIEDSGASGSWDFVLTGGGDAALMLTPHGAFFGFESTAGLAVLEDESFDELATAPSANSAYETEDAVPLEEGVIYVVRSRSGVACSGASFAKLEPLVIDQAEGTVEFQLSANPNCNDTDLIPPED